MNKNFDKMSNLGEISFGEESEEGGFLIMGGKRVRKVGFDEKLSFFFNLSTYFQVVFYHFTKQVLLLQLSLFCFLTNEVNFFLLVWMDSGIYKDSTWINQ